MADPVNTCLPVLVSGWSHKGKKRFEMLKAAWPKRRAGAVPTLPRSIPTCAAHPFQTSLACPPAVSSPAAGPPSPPSPGSPLPVLGEAVGVRGAQIYKPTPRATGAVLEARCRAVPGQWLCKAQRALPCTSPQVFPSALGAVTRQGWGGEAGLCCCSPHWSRIPSLAVAVCEGESRQPGDCTLRALGRAYLSPSAARGAEGNALLCEGLGLQGGVILCLLLSVLQQVLLIRS